MAAPESKFRGNERSNGRLTGFLLACAAALFGPAAATRSIDAGHGGRGLHSDTLLNDDWLSEQLAEAAVAVITPQVQLGRLMAAFKAIPASDQMIDNGKRNEGKKHNRQVHPPRLIHEMSHRLLPLLVPSKRASI